VDVALRRLAPQVVVTARSSAAGGPLRGFSEVAERVDAYPGQPAATSHAVIQLSSGSTGPSKVIGRDAASLVEEVRRYTLIDGVPRGGERIVSLASMVHVLGLVGGLLFSLHAGVHLMVAARALADGILSAVAPQRRPRCWASPFHMSCWPRCCGPLPQLTT
jgi:acyl-coenzyme A synthetase/AMP-(fatty) acid ligase